MVSEESLVFLWIYYAIQERLSGGKVKCLFRFLKLYWEIIYHKMHPFNRYVHSLNNCHNCEKLTSSITNCKSCLFLLVPVCYHYLDFLLIWLHLGHPVLCTLRVSIYPWSHTGSWKLFGIFSSSKQHLQHPQQHYWRIYLCLLGMCYYYTAKNKNG